MKLSKPLIILLSIYALIGTYFLTGVVDIALNGKILKLSKYYNASFTFKALINGYPKIYESLAISFAICVAFIAILLLLPKKEKLYGDAKFATAADIAKRKLYGNDGIIIGKYNGKLLRFPGQQFVSLAAATRGGKGVSVVIPNLMDWQQSAVVQDIKQECFDFTSRYRKEVLGQDVYLFNPFSSRTHRYNPLTYFDINSPEADSTLNSLANIFFPPPVSGDPIWSQLSQDLFIGIAYLLGELISTRLGIAFLNSKKIDLDLTFYDILRFSILGLDTQIEEEGSDGEVTSVKLNTLDSSYTFLEQCGLVSDKVKMRMKAYVETEAKMKNSVLKSFQGPLKMFQSDYMRFATSGNDFDFRDLRKKKMTIYVGITPDNLPIAKPILNVFWQQLFTVNTKELPQANPDLKYKVLLMMDEFSAIGYLSIYLKSIAFIAGYNLRSVMIYQNTSQLEIAQPDGYGQHGAKTLLSNHACRIYFAPDTQEDAKAISESLGTKTVRNRSKSFGKESGGGSESDASRALMLPQELVDMPFEDELIRIAGGGRFIKCKKAFYYNDPYFIDKFKSISPTLRKSKQPSEDDYKLAAQLRETSIEIPEQSLEQNKKDRDARIVATFERIIQEDKAKGVVYDDEEEDYDEEFA